MRHGLTHTPEHYGNYEPGNCRWATQKDQQNNKRKRGTGWKGRTKYPRTHCLKGHPLDTTNTYVNPSNGKRQCKTCQRARQEKAKEAEGRTVAA